MGVSTPIREGQNAMRQATGEASDWIERFARAGYFAKGVVYVLIGVLAARAALHGNSPDESGSSNAFRMILHQPFGRILLGIVAAGLVGYALWRFVQAALDPDHKGSDAKGLAIRGGYAGSGLIHGGLALGGFRMAFGDASAGASGSNQSTQHWTAKLMAWPGGVWLVGLTGVAVIIFGLYQFYRGHSEKFEKRLRLSTLTFEVRQWIIRICKAGLYARGISFAIIGWFLIHAAMNHNPQKAKGLGGALTEVQQAPYGKWLLSAFAIGLMSYGVYEFVRARFRRISSV